MCMCLQNVFKKKKTTKICNEMKTKKKNNRKQKTNFNKRLLIAIHKADRNENLRSKNKKTKKLFTSAVCCVQCFLQHEKLKKIFF